MNCPNCGGPFQLDEGKEHLHCEYCGTMHFPEPNADGVKVLGTEASSLCPVCRERLVHAAVSGQRTLYCERCRGMLIPMETFLAVVQHLRNAPDKISAPPRPVDRKDLHREARCPHCHELMDTHVYAGPGNVVIDNCRHCAANWLDHSELKQIVSAPAEHAPQTD